MTRRSFRRTICVHAIVCMMTASVFIFAQPQRAEAQLADNQRAVLAFDVYMDRLTSSDLAKGTGVSAPDGPLSTGGPNETFKPDEVRRIMGAVSPPPSVQSIQQIGPGTEQLDFDFFVRIQFKTAELADKAVAKMAAKSEKATIGGKEYYRPPADEPAPKNMAMHQSAPDTIELGTDRYLALPNRNVFTSNLQTAWPKMPKAGIRIALDFDGARHLIDEGLKMAPGGIPAPAQPAVSLLNATSVLRVGVDFTGENLLWLTATGADADSANQINGILGGLLAMAKGAGQQFLPMAGPDAQEPGTAILNALAATQDGNDVNIVIPRPEGLEKAVSAAMGQMMMGGGGAGGELPPGFGDGPPADDPFGGSGDPFN